MKVLKAYYQAQQVYLNESCPRTLEEDIRLHLKNGYVLSRPDCFGLARPVYSGADPADIVNPEVIFYEAGWDCWHAYLVTGNPKIAFYFLPFELPMISFERKNDLRFYKFPRIKEFLTK